MNDPGQYVVIDDVFHYTTKRGAPISIDFDFPPDAFKAAEEKDTEQEQFDAVSSWLGDDTRDAYREMGGLERARFVRTFFLEWQKAAGLTLGESLSSSSSSASTEQP